MIEKVYQCKVCGFKFKLALTEQEHEAGGAPCPGCGETALVEIHEEAGPSIMSRGAACSGNCRCCPSHGECDEADIKHE